MHAIVAVDEHWGIGRDGGMLFSLPEDLRYFARMTRGKTVVMGRNTLLSLPGGKPLEGRRNVVLSRDPDFTVEGAQTVHSLEELARQLRGVLPDETMLIGGESLYRDLLPHCEKAYVTRVLASAPADRFFPDLDALPGWRLASRSGEREENGLRYAWCVYENMDVKPLEPHSGA